tara:strand:- start:2820 stop:3707 length:888 start_codon:yes stop_codon:yes gene_type:complete
MSSVLNVVNINKGKYSMPSKNGFVMAWRDMKKQPWYNNPDCVAVFTHIMLSATSKPFTFNRKGAVCQLMPGDFVTTYEELGAQFNLDKSKVRRIIGKFVKNGQVTKRIIATNKINKGIIISLTGWNKWQNNSDLSDTWNDTQSDTQSDTSRVANIKGSKPYADTQADTLPDTQADTVLNNKVNNNKVINNKKSLGAPRKKNNVSLPSDFQVTKEMFDWARAEGVTCNIKFETSQFIDHHTAKDSKFANWKSAWRTWMRNTLKFSNKPKSTHSTKSALGPVGQSVADTMAGMNFDE